MYIYIYAMDEYYLQGTTMAGIAMVRKPVFAHGVKGLFTVLAWHSRVGNRFSYHCSPSH